MKSSLAPYGVISAVATFLQFCSQLLSILPWVLSPDEEAFVIVSLRIVPKLPSFKLLSL